MEGLCEFLQIPFEDNLLQPYEGKRMTDGIHAQSMPIGDPNFAKGLFRNKFGLRYPTDNGGDGRNQLKKAELIFKQLLNMIELTIN